MIEMCEKEFRSDKKKYKKEVSSLREKIKVKILFIIIGRELN
jgi:hypothetical protein